MFKYINNIFNIIVNCWYITIIIILIIKYKEYDKNAE